MKVIMQKSIINMEKQTSGIGHGISIGLLSNVKIKDQTGSSVSLDSVAILNQNKNVISVVPFDPSTLKLIEETLKNCGFNAFVFSKREVAVTVPQQSGEEKDKINKLVKKIAEETKVAIRNIRKRFRQETIKDKEEQKKRDKDIDVITNEFINIIDDMVIEKLGT